VSDKDLVSQVDDFLKDDSSKAQTASAH
jgi:hypothetical protein